MAFKKLLPNLNQRVITTVRNFPLAALILVVTKTAKMFGFVLRRLHVQRIVKNTLPMATKSYLFFVKPSSINNR
jgi:hypothetical protein